MTAHRLSVNNNHTAIVLNRVAIVQEISNTQDIAMEFSFFEKQDMFLEKMKADSENLSSVYSPYFHWKFADGNIPSQDQLKAMSEFASQELDRFYELYPDAYSEMDSFLDNDPWQNYKGFGKDK